MQLCLGRTLQIEISLSLSETLRHYLYFLFPFPAPAPALFLQRLSSQKFCSGAVRLRCITSLHSFRCFTLIAAPATPYIHTSPLVFRIIRSRRFSFPHHLPCPSYTRFCSILWHRFSLPFLPESYLNAHYASVNLSIPLCHTFTCPIPPPF